MKKAALVWSGFEVEAGMRVVLGVVAVVGLMSGAAWAGDIVGPPPMDFVTQDQIQSVPRDKLDHMLDHQNQLIASANAFAGAAQAGRASAENEARHMNIGSVPCPYSKLPQTTKLDMLATLMNCQGSF